MAYISDEEQEKKEGMNVLSPQETQVQKTEAPLVENANIQASQEQAPQPINQKKIGTGFVNLKKYVEANKPATTQMARDISTNVQSQAANIGQQLQQREEAFKQQIEQNKQRLSQAQQFGQQAIQQAGQQTASPQDIERFKAITSGQESFSNIPQIDLQKQQAAAQQLSKQVGGAGTSEGRAQLLRSTFGGKGQQYTAGQQNLDRLLLGGNQEARKQVIQQLTGIDKPITQQLQNIGEQAIGSLTNLKAEESGARESLRKQLETARTGTESDITKALQAAQSKEQEAQQNYEKLAQMFGSGKVEDVNAGIQKLADQGLIGVGDIAKIQAMQDVIQKQAPSLNIADILKSGLVMQEGTGVTRAGVTTAEQRARANALAQLSGVAEEFGVNSPEFKESYARLDTAKAQQELADRIKALSGQGVDYSGAELDALKRILAPSASQLGEDYAKSQEALNLLEKMPPEERAKALAMGAFAAPRYAAGQTLAAGTGTYEGLKDILSGNIGSGAEGLYRTYAGFATSPFDIASGYLKSAPIIKDIGGKQASRLISGTTGAIKDVGSSVKKEAKKAKEKVKKMLSDKRLKDNINPAGNNIEKLLDLIGKKNEF